MRLERSVGEVRYRSGPLGSDELAEALVQVDAVLAGLDRFDESVFARTPRLRVVARYGAGVDNIDLVGAARNGIVVTNTPGANANAVAELTIALLLALARPLLRAVESVRLGEWTAPRGFEIAGRTLGLVGLGAVGRLVATKASELGCHVVACDPLVGEAEARAVGAQLVTREHVVAVADVLSLHVPLTAETRDMVDRRLLQSMKPGAALINTARGELVVEEDLLRALEEGHLRAAALDTLREEPPPPQHPLLRREDVIVTPHMGGQTDEAVEEMAREAIDDLLAVLSGEPPRHPVEVVLG
ncbi:MAG TPA: phosphoglycerate dehydrogenase [Candidatus Baltobacterales bacterium]|nr:phosphoglycerate dehydrogenase [Candidatus Baltobacterales bacterium]